MLTCIGSFCNLCLARVLLLIGMSTWWGISTLAISLFHFLVPFCPVLYLNKPTMFIRNIWLFAYFIYSGADWDIYEGISRKFERSIHGQVGPLLPLWDIYYAIMAQWATKEANAMQCMWIEMEDKRNSCKLHANALCRMWSQWFFGLQMASGKESITKIQRAKITQKKGTMWYSSRDWI